MSRRRHGGSAVSRCSVGKGCRGPGGTARDRPGRSCGPGARPGRGSRRPGGRRPRSARKAGPFAQELGLDRRQHHRSLPGDDHHPGGTRADGPQHRAHGQLQGLVVGQARLHGQLDWLLNGERRTGLGLALGGHDQVSNELLLAVRIRTIVPPRPGAASCLRPAAARGRPPPPRAAGARMGPATAPGHCHRRWPVGRAPTSRQAAPGAPARRPGPRPAPRRRPDGAAARVPAVAPGRRPGGGACGPHAWPAPAGGRRGQSRWGHPAHSRLREVVGPRSRPAHRGAEAVTG
jgi:hypothetical protein